MNTAYWFCNETIKRIFAIVAIIFSSPFLVGMCDCAETMGLAPPEGNETPVDAAIILEGSSPMFDLYQQKVSENPLH
jgi:hypothetical protein